MSSNIFEKNEDPVTSTQTDPLAELTTKLAEIKNEAGEPKYNDLNTALDALVESQKYIPTLKEEKERLEKELEEVRSSSSARENIEEVVKQLLNEAGERDADPRSDLTEESVAKLVDKTLQERTHEQQLKDNLSMVSNSLTEQFGDEKVAREEMAKKASALGISTEKMAQLAQESPQVVISLFGGQKASTPTPTTTSTVNTTAFKPAEKPLEKPSKSLLAGASSNDQKDFMLKIKEDVYKKHGIVT